MFDFTEIGRPHVCRSTVTPFKRFDHLITYYIVKCSIRRNISVTHAHRHPAQPARDYEPKITSTTHLDDSVIYIRITIQLNYLIGPEQFQFQRISLAMCARNVWGNWSNDYYVHVESVAELP